VPPPGDCPRFASINDGGAGLREAVEFRLARGRQIAELTEGPHGYGWFALWCRCWQSPRVATIADLACIGDFMPMGFADAFGAHYAGNSLVGVQLPLCCRDGKHRVSAHGLVPLWTVRRAPKSQGYFWHATTHEMTESMANRASRRPPRVKSSPGFASIRAMSAWDMPVGSNPPTDSSPCAPQAACHAVIIERI
jgi:hypothetical protein